MKKFFLAICLIAGFSTQVFSQDEIDDTFVFTLGNGGPVISNGSTIDITESEAPDPFTPGVKFISGVFVKNTSSQSAYPRIKAEILSKDNGYVQICFGGQCTILEGLVETAISGQKAGASASLLDDWFPTSYGKCAVKYTILSYNYLGLVNFSPVYDYNGEGSTITVNYIYTDPAGINDNITDSNAKVSYYDLSGVQLSQPAKGVNIKKMVLSNGSVKTSKIIVK